MSFRVTDVNGHPAHSNIKQFMCTSVDDISMLPREGINGTLLTGTPDDNEPCGIGSTALIKGDGAYALFPDNEWARI